MNRLLILYLMGLMQDAVSGADAGGGSGTVVAQASAGAPVVTEPAPTSVDTVNSTPTDTPTPEAGQTDDLFSQLEQLLPKDDAPATPEGTPEAGTEAQVPEQLQAALGISPFVTSAEAIPQAIQAADEVWKVANGQIPARQLLEGFRNERPQQFPAIAQDLAGYLQELGVIQAPQNPLEALKGTRPDVYNAVAQFVQQQTGKPLDIDPNDPMYGVIQEMNSLRDERRREREAQETAAWNAQVETARKSATDWMTKTLTNTFADGMADRYVANNGLLWQKAQQMNIAPDKVMQELVAGKTDTLAKLWKAVEKDEAATIRKFNQNLVKQHNTLKNAVPASKGAPVTPTAGQDGVLERKPGENDVDYGVRVWRSIK